MGTAGLRPAMRQMSDRPHRRRLCLLLTGHRQACTAWAATSGRRTGSAGPVLEGRDAHAGVFRLRGPHLIPA